MIWTICYGILALSAFLLICAALGKEKKADMVYDQLLVIVLMSLAWPVTVVIVGGASIAAFAENVVKAKDKELENDTK